MNTLAKREISLVITPADQLKFSVINITNNAYSVVR